MVDQFAIPTCVRNKTTLIRLHRWMKEEKISTDSLSPQILCEYRSWCGGQDLKPTTCDVEYYNARSYIVWMIRSGHLKANVTDFFRISLKPVNFPEYTVLFLKQRKVATKYAHTRFRQLLHLFHNWLTDQKIDILNLSHGDAVSFLAFLSTRGYTPKQLHIRRLHIRIYLDWLRDRDIIKIDCRDLFETVEQFRNYELPKYAKEYLSEIQTTLREDTVKSYKTNFMTFHRFLHREDIDIKNLNRDHCLSWMRYMFENKKYSASTRLQRLVNTRGYLHWLVDRGIISVDVDKLIRSSDFPEIDLILPKPIAPDIDVEIQRRLTASGNIYHKGALLLRLTGMRLGELANLSFDPVWRDDSGKTYIKIPVGKMHSERLVPISKKTIELIKTIQKDSMPHLKKYSKNPEEGTLLLGPKGGSALHNVYRLFKIITKDLKGQGSIHPHRLRHTFATALINAGLNPLVIMVLMGHKDIRMTSRYSLISNDTIYRSYFKAIEDSEFKIEFKFRESTSSTDEFDPMIAFENIIKWIQSDSNSNERAKTLIVKRLNRLRGEIENIS